MANLTSSLTIKLVDDVSRPARTVAQALQDAEKQAKAVEKAMAGAGASDRLNASLAKLKVGAKDIDAVSRAWKDYSASAKLAANASDWTKAQAAGVRRWESQTISALKAVQKEEAAFARASKKAMADSGHGGMSGRQIAAGIAGGYAAHETAHFAHQSLETYREFDKERRFGKAVMGISDADQGALVQQAIHMGGSTKYNDIQVLEAQRELAARGLKKEQIIGMMPAAADLGQSLNLSLPDAVKQMEGAIFGFKKNIETTSDALASARQTADVQVRAAKISGMTPEDIKDTYKYGATPARLSGVSEQTLLAFGGISKKANMAGNEAGTAFRALMSAANAPTRGAKEALLANGLDFSKYQKQVSSIPVDGFARNVAAQYGVKLNTKALGSIAKIFNDPKLLNDASLFTPAVVSALGGTLGKKDAKSLKSIAGMANRFRTSAGGGADVNAFLVDLMKKMADPKSGIALANSIFGAKQGGRIANALGDPGTLNKMIETLTNHSEGYAAKIAEERMAGFDGAVSRFEGATKNLETALGRAFDNDGKGGFLTGVADAAGKATQSLAELPGPVLQVGAAFGILAGGLAGLKGLESVMGGFGLKASAASLTGAAEALMAAAEVQGGGKLGGGALGTAAKVAGGIGVLGAGIVGAGAIAATAPLILARDPDKQLGGSKAEDYNAGNELPGMNEGVQRQEKNATGGASLDGLSAKAFDTKAALDSVSSMTVAPQADVGALDAIIAKLTAINSLVAAVNGGISGAGAAASRLQIPSLGATQRSNFTTGGIAGGSG